jgi:hypothetical protein
MSHKGLKQQVPTKKFKEDTLFKVVQKESPESRGTNPRDSTAYFNSHDNYMDLQFLDQQTNRISKIY